MVGVVANNLEVTTFITINYTTKGPRFVTIDDSGDRVEKVLPILDMSNMIEDY